MPKTPVLPLPFLAATGALLVVGWVDKEVGELINDSVALTPLFLLPLIYCAWFVSWRWMLGVVVLALCLLGLAISFNASKLATTIVVIAQALVYAIVLPLTYNLKAALEHERKASRTDVLTGLGNTRAINEKGSLEIERMKRFGGPLVALFLDLDNFKSVNDTYGHSVGDDLLHAWGLAISTNIRTVDSAARMGGDEFAIIMPMTTLPGARVVIRRIKATCQLLAPKLPVACSVGVVCFEIPPKDMDHLLQLVDQTMYRAKGAGKNRECFREVSLQNGAFNEAEVEPNSLEF